MSMLTKNVFVIGVLLAFGIAWHIAQFNLALMAVVLIATLFIYNECNIIYLEALGKPIVVLNSATAVYDLLDKRSSIYSDRPPLMLVLRPYGDVFKAQRKLVAHDFSQSVIPNYYSIQELEARKLVFGILNDPTSLVSQIEHRVASIILRVTYGYTVKEEDVPMMTTALAAHHNFSNAAMPGTRLVDAIPCLQYLPSWAPGAKFLRTASEWRETVRQASWNPYLWCKENLDNGIASTPNLCATTVIEKGGQLTHDEEVALVSAALTVLGGALETNLQKRRRKLTPLWGTIWLPTITDKECLPYIRSLIAEMYRWAPALPLSLPHALRQDDSYEGFHIPRGSAVIANVWHMLRDPDVYANPTEFRPERYGGDEVAIRKVTDLTFGFGRRACPGLAFAEGSMFAIMSTILATCDIISAKDSQGKDIIPQLKYTGDVIILPENVQCDIRPRSARSRTLLSEALIL
ncbi:putative monooxygenase [Laetiporus sulphureus 93-53]|uniref:Putative monooxygenase n=1 Tax=Laetiporus sulphureus 93-53 TaxID=1314785 RepID=A0A165HDW3_9APHY|nr:putative monooxygenase [Laetiporus sulphureus 93-53]KZT11605.1 putative monooxygenase [Laetiporus sulphureus 93-53]